MPVYADDSDAFVIGKLRAAAENLGSVYLSGEFHQYLDSIFENGMTSARRFGSQSTVRRPIDLVALTLANKLNKVSALQRLIGAYLITLFGHQWANAYLKEETDERRILYLRGFDVSTIIGAGGLLVEPHTTPTQMFSYELRQQFSEFSIFKTTGSDDTEWNVLTMQRHYYDGDYPALRQACAGSPFSFHLNSSTWREDISGLINQVDHIIVYVDMVSEGLEWELNHLRNSGRAKDTTLIFNERGTTIKRSALADQLAAANNPWMFSIISGTGKDMAQELTADQLRTQLGEDFRLISREEFLGSLEEFRERVRSSRRDLTDPAGFKPLRFQFWPAVSDEDLDTIRDFDEDLNSAISHFIEPGNIPDAGLLINFLQLRIYTTLLLGRHRDAGRALAALDGALQAILHNVLQGRVSPPRFEVENSDMQRVVNILIVNQRFLSLAGLRLMAYSDGDKFTTFTDYAEKDNCEYNDIAEAASNAVHNFMQRYFS